jgi:hypothetical protein
LPAGSVTVAVPVQPDVTVYDPDVVVFVLEPLVDTYQLVVMALVPSNCIRPEMELTPEIALEVSANPLPLKA